MYVFSKSKVATVNTNFQKVVDTCAVKAHAELCSQSPLFHDKQELIKKCLIIQSEIHGHSNLAGGLWYNNAWSSCPLVGLARYWQRNCGLWVVHLWDAKPWRVWRMYVSALPEPGGVWGGVGREDWNKVNFSSRGHKGQPYWNCSKHDKMKQEHRISYLNI